MKSEPETPPKMRRFRDALAKYVLGYTLIALVACSGPRAQIPDPAPDQAQVDDLMERYEAHREAVEPVPLPEHREALGVVVDLWEAWQLCRVDLEETEALGLVDARLAASRQAAAEAERDRARRDRWLWGAVGVALGVALGLVAGISL